MEDRDPVPYLEFVLEKEEESVVVGGGGHPQTVVQR